MDRNIESQFVSQMMVNPHLHPIGYGDDSDIIDGEAVNRYFDAEAKRSVFVRRDQLKVISRNKLRRHSTKHRTLCRDEDSLRNRFRVNCHYDLDSKSSTVTSSSDIALGRRLRTRSDVPGKDGVCFEQKYSLKSRPFESMPYSIDRRRESQPTLSSNRCSGTNRK